MKYTRRSFLKRATVAGTTASFIVAGTWTSGRMLSASDRISLGVANAGWPKDAIVFNDNGCWCWFHDQQAIIQDGRLMFGSVATRAGTGGKARAGNIEVTTYDSASGEIRVSVLAANYEADDHCVPGLHARRDGRVLAVFAGHDTSKMFQTRISAPRDSRTWEKGPVLMADGGACYANLLLLGDANGGTGRLYNFYRREGVAQYYFVSDDEGANWTHAGPWLRVPGTRQRSSFARYASNGKDTIHFVFTDGNPGSHTASIYHAFYRDGSFHTSDGRQIKPLTEAPLACREATVVFQGSTNNRAWTNALRLDAKGYPYTVYSVLSVLKRVDHRYRYARWDGKQWRDYPLAYGGTPFCGQSHYSGLAAVDPADPNVTYVSTNVDPATGKAVGTGKHEIYRGVTTDGGESWQWQPITANSPVDNLRPIITPMTDGVQALLWVRGKYGGYTHFDTSVVGFILRGDAIRSQSLSSEARL